MKRQSKAEEALAKQVKNLRMLLKQEETNADAAPDESKLPKEN